MDNFIVVGHHTELMLQVLLALHTYANEQCVVVGDDVTRALRWSSLCSRHVEVGLDGNDDEEFVRAIRQLAEDMPQAILIPADVHGTRIIHRVRSDLTIRIIPIPDSATLERFNNKWLFHEFCKEHDFKVPPTRFVASKHDMDFDAMVAELGLPVVIKPLDQWGSEGIHIVPNKAFYDEAIRDNEDYRFAPLIVQGYISGVDMGLNVFSMQGKLAAFAVQQKVGSKVSFLSNDYLEQLAYRLCLVSGYNGVMNLDARLEEGTGTVYLFEANPRFWGSLTASVWNRLNFVAESIEQIPGTDGVRKLTSGEFEPHRHPIIRPNWWPSLVFDRGVHGRMLRAMMFDIYILSSFVGSLPSRLWRKLAHCQTAPAVTRSSHGAKTPC
jgi:predicted ATP-grasp superfamily ATP-dependent carboligase